MFRDAPVQDNAGPDRAWKLPAEAYRMPTNQGSNRHHFNALPVNPESNTMSTFKRISAFLVAITMTFMLESEVCEGPPRWESG